MRTVIHGGDIVNEGRTIRGSVVIEDGVITDINECKDAPCGSYDKTVDATGCFVLPGVIDCHVHFREPGLTSKADIGSESEAAAWGGVTTYFDMPNTIPQTTTEAALDGKLALAKEKSHVNYAFFIGATNDNIDEICRIDVRKVPGVKLFMGSSTGNMLVDHEEALSELFRLSPLPVMAHCEDTATINANMAEAKRVFGDDPDVARHPDIRSAEACVKSTELAVRLARTYGARLHVAHVSTADELRFFGESPNITAEAVIAHLAFCDEDYAGLGALIKCNPAIKTSHDREALRQALATGLVKTVGTDHAPHSLADKQGGCARAASGMPMVQFSLVTMLGLVDAGYITMERLVELMCHNPASLFEVRERGYLRPGYKADIVVVRRGEPWTVTKDIVRSKCGWSPVEGREYRWRVCRTICNGRVVFDNGVFDGSCRGERVLFR